MRKTTRLPILLISLLFVVAAVGTAVSASHAETRDRYGTDGGSSGSGGAPVADEGPFIQPGKRSTHGGSACTLNFVYDGTGPLAGNVYVGTAAHCVDRIGQSVSTDDYANFGTVAFLRNEDVTPLDYAFILVKPTYEDRVRADVVARGAPTGFTRDADTGLGNTILFSGYGIGFSTTSLTRENRAGLHLDDDHRQYTAEGPILFGDSGGPILHDSGKAYGIVSRIVFGVGDFYGAWIEGPTVEGILSDAGAQGFPVKLRA